MALAAYASVAVLCAASLCVGGAALSLCGRRELRWLSGPVGLAALIVVGGITIELPGHSTTAAITLAFLFLASVAVLVVRKGTPAGPTALALAAAGIALLLASIPFIANDRVGILGVGLVNDDMASHLLIADWLQTRMGETPVLIDQGYPLGPHALVAGLGNGLGIGLIEGFAGLTLTIPVLTALVAFEALDGLRRVPRVICAALTALPYLAAAYLAQEAFKEPIEALFLLGFALLLPTVSDTRRAIPLGVIAAGAVYTYSFPGLAWLAGTAAIWGVVVWARARRGPSRTAPGMRPHGDVAHIRGRLSGRPPAPLAAVAAGLAALLVLTLPEWGRLLDFMDFRAFRESTISSGLGNLRHQLSPLEALGIWPASDFRLSAADASGPAAAFYLGALVAGIGLAVGLPRWIRRHGAAVPAALCASALAYLGALAFGTVYTSAKALAIAAPLVALIAFGGLLDRGGAGALGRRLLALALAAGMLFSSFLVLRQAPVAPEDHASQLAELRPLVEGDDVLFLGRDNFIAYELRGSRPFTAVRNYYDPHYVRPNLRQEDVFQKFDFDSVTPRTLARFPFVVTTRAAYASGPPPGFESLRVTSDFVLWQRTGPVGPRRTLAEGDHPGAVLDCSGVGAATARRGGQATVLAPAPVAAGRWTPSATAEDGSPVSQTVRLGAGRWSVSLQYDATRRVTVEAPGFTANLPANLDYRGSVPYYPAGELRVRRPGPVRFTVSVERPPLAGRLLGTQSEAHLGAIAVSPGGRGDPIPGQGERKVPLAEACGRYVDWYYPSAAR